MKKQKAFFFDRDGIVNYRPVGDYVKSFNEFRFIHDFFDFFIKIKEAGFLCILISNQQGVGKGMFSNVDLDLVTKNMQDELFNLTGYKFDDINYCTDLSTTNSPRRKPNPGMILEMIEKWDIDKSTSWMIGDSKYDIMAGKAAGVRTILVTTENDDNNADIVVLNLKELNKFKF